ncbi:MAG: phage holin family protein [Undibacterium sp.]|nr:phage holin family protein [Undibacterium sp.]
MNSKDSVSGPGTVANFVTGLFAIAKSGMGLLRLKMELAKAEAEQMRRTLLKVLAVFMLALVMFWFVLAYGSALLVSVFWATMGWKILAVMSAFFTIALAGLLLYLNAMLRELRNNAGRCF